VLSTQNHGRRRAAVRVCAPLQQVLEKLGQANRSGWPHAPSSSTKTRRSHKSRPHPDRPTPTNEPETRRRTAKPCLATGAGLGDPRGVRPAWRRPPSVDTLFGQTSISRGGSGHHHPAPAVRPGGFFLAGDPTMTPLPLVEADGQWTKPLFAARSGCGFLGKLGP